VKFGFILMSIISAVALSVLSMIFATGRIPGEEIEPEVPGAEVATGDVAEEETLAVFSDKSKDVENLISALDKERDLYTEKIVKLKTEEQESKLQFQMLEKLKAQLLDIRGVLDEKISDIEDDEKERKVQQSKEETENRIKQAKDERSNLRRLAEVTGRMEPESAAKMLAEMEPERAANILYLVNERKSAGILDAAVAAGDLGTALAAEWVEIIRRLKKEGKSK